MLATTGKIATPTSIYWSKSEGNKQKIKTGFPLVVTGSIDTNVIDTLNRDITVPKIDYKK